MLLPEPLGPTRAMRSPRRRPIETCSRPPLRISSDGVTTSGVGRASAPGSIGCRRVGLRRDRVPVDEIDAVDPLPLRIDAGARRAHLRRAPDRVGARVVGPRAREALQVRGDRPEHAARLLRVLVDHEDAADEKRAVRAARAPRVADDEAPGEADAQQVDHAPLRFVQDDALLHRREHRVEPAPQQPPRALLQAQAQHRRRVADEVEQAGGVAARQVVLARLQPHHAAVDCDDERGDERVADQRERAERRRDQHEREQRADEGDDAVHVDELVLREVVQRMARLADPVVHLARVPALVPGERRARQPRVERVGDAAAHAHADVALEDATGPVQRPGCNRHQADRADPERGARRSAGAALLQRIDRLGGEPGNGEPQRLRRGQQRGGAEQSEASAFGEAPDAAVERAEGGAGTGREEDIVTFRWPCP